MGARGWKGGRASCPLGREAADFAWFRPSCSAEWRGAAAGGGRRGATLVCQRARAVGCPGRGPPSFEVDAAQVREDCWAQRTRRTENGEWGIGDGEWECACGAVTGDGGRVTGGFDGGSVRLAAASSESPLARVISGKEGGHPAHLGCGAAALGCRGVLDGTNGRKRTDGITIQLCAQRAPHSPSPIPHSPPGATPDCPLSSFRESSPSLCTDICLRGAGNRVIHPPNHRRPCGLHKLACA